MTKEKLSRLHRWILVEAYKEILKNGSSKPIKLDWITNPGNTPSHLLRIEVIRDYFKIPVRTQHKEFGGEYLVIDTSQVTPEKANTVRTTLTRSLTRLKERGLISHSIVLTARGIEIAKELLNKP